MPSPSFVSSRRSTCLFALAFLGVAALVGCGGDETTPGDTGTSSGGGSSGGGGAGGGSSSGGTEPALTGTLTWNGTTEPCEVSQQDIAVSEQYSVLCQTRGNDDGTGSVLVQVTFKDEPSARAPGEFTVKNGVAFSPAQHPDPRTAESTVVAPGNAYAAKESSTGTMTVAAQGDGTHVLTITEQQQFLPEDDSPMIVSATINF